MPSRASSFALPAKLLLCMVLLAQVTGCATYDRFRESRFGAAQLLNPQRITPKNPRSTVEVGKEWQQDGARPSEYTMFYRAEYTASTSGTADAISKYYKQGIVLSDSVCNAWFDTLEETQANVQFTKNNTVIAAAAATTIMGAVEAAAKEIAVVAAAFAGASSVMDNYQSTFLFTPDMHIVRKKIDGLREVAVKKMFVDDVPGDYAEAKRRLLKYHQICSGSEVRDLIQTAVVHTRYEFDPVQRVTQIQAAATQVLQPDRSVGTALLGAMDANADLQEKLTALAGTTPTELAALRASGSALQTSATDIWKTLGKSGTKPTEAAHDALVALKTQVDSMLADATAAVKLAGSQDNLKESLSGLQALAASLQASQASLDSLNRAYAMAGSLR